MKILLGLTLSLALRGAMIDGAKINFAVSGKGDKTVVFVHGWTCDATTWSKQIPTVAGRFQVVALDLPGHGKSGMPKGAFSMDLFAKTVEGVRRDVHVDKMILVGHSMGTSVIRRYAKLFPQHVAAMVVVDGSVLTRPENAERVKSFQGSDASKARLEFIRSMFSSATKPDLRARIEKMMMTPSDVTAAGAMAALGEINNWKDDVISAPVLGIYAENSRRANREVLSRIFPSFEYAEIPGTGHFLMLEKPEEFNRVLIAFLDKLQ
jgi:pimeloyl-ACP methyl ester carboxylesterase